MSQLVGSMESRFRAKSVARANLVFVGRNINRPGGVAKQRGKYLIIIEKPHLRLWSILPSV